MAARTTTGRLLRPFRAHRAWYLLSTVDGFSKQQIHNSVWASESGLVEERRIGLMPVRVEVVALFSEEYRIKFRVGSLEFDLTDSSIHAQCAVVFPMVKSFRLFRGAQEILAFRYFFNHFLDDGFEERDVFEHVAKCTSSLGDKMQFICFWQLIQNGDNPEANGFDERVESLIRHQAAPDQ